MKIDEIILDESFDSFKKGIAAIALAGSLSLIPKINSNPIIHADPELTKIGRETIKNLPISLQKRLGNPNKIIFVKGIPKYGNPKAICQIEEGERIIYVNPKFVDKFLGGAGDQLSAHELTHIAQDNVSKNISDKYPKSSSNDENLYGQMSSDNAWQILKDLRKKGDRMWNHSREEQAMIVQQREAAFDMLNQMLKTPKQYKNEIKQQKEKISIFDEYIDDYNSN